MWKKFIFLKIFIYINILIISINCENDNITNYRNEFYYNMSNPEDAFFNDICKYFSSENKTDVSLEYRRRYYYYPNGKQHIINNPDLLNKIFPKPKRNNIFLCFNNYFLSDDSLALIITIYIILPVFFFQFVGLIIYLSGKYKYVSEKTQEQYFNYMKNKEMKQHSCRRNYFMKGYINKNASTSNINDNNYNNDNSNVNKDTFTSFQEEENNNDFMNFKDNKNIKDSKKEDEYKNDTFISQTVEIKQEIKEKDITEGEGEEEREDEFQNDYLNNTGVFQRSEEKEIKEDNKDEIKQSIYRKNLNPDEIYTFGGLKLNNMNSNGNEESNEKIKETESKKAEKIEYLYNKINNNYNNNQINNYDKNNNANNNINNHNIYNNNSISNKNINIQKNDNSSRLTNEELFYGGFSVAILFDKRTFKEIYFDILSHCQIIFYFLPNYYIYEDIGLTMIYYTFKFILYFPVVMLLFNSTSVINQIYDNQFFFIDFLLRSLLSTIIVNMISQFLFILINSKKTYIRYINKMKHSLFGKKRILRYVIKDIVDLITSNLYCKLLILFVLSIIIFIFTFYFCICFCLAYFHTQFYIIKCVFLSIIISQICPFIFAFIPAKLRKKALERKDNKLYIISKVINSYFLP